MRLPTWALSILVVVLTVVALDLAVFHSTVWGLLATSTAIGLLSILWKDHNEGR